MYTTIFFKKICVKIMQSVRALRTFICMYPSLWWMEFNVNLREFPKPVQLVHPVCPRQLLGVSHKLVATIVFVLCFAGFYNRSVD